MYVCLLITKVKWVPPPRARDMSVNAFDIFAEVQITC